MALYKKRSRWAEAYFRSHFCAGMCSTQRCEGMNCQFKKLLRPTTPISAVMGRLEWKQRCLRDRVLRDNFNAQNSTPQFHSDLRKLEEHCCKIFSHDIFIMIKSQIKFQGRFVVHQDSHFLMQTPSCFMWGSMTELTGGGRLSTVATKATPNGYARARCMNLMAFHVLTLFSVFRNELVTEFPACPIKKRWTREIGETMTVPSCLEVPNDSSAKSARYASLLIQAGKACLSFSESTEGFNSAMTELEKLKANSMKYKPVVDEHPAPCTEPMTVVRDPLKSKTKGMMSDTEDNAVKKANTCGRCHRPGHNKRSCKVVLPVPAV